MVFAGVSHKHIQIPAETLWRKLAFCRRGSEWLDIFADLWFLLESIINIYKFLLKLCGENWLFVGEALRGCESYVVLRFLLKSIENKHNLRLKFC